MKKKHQIFRSALRNRTSARALMLGLIGTLAVSPAAVGQSVPNTSANSPLNLDLGSVLATGTASNNGDASIPGTAANEAPSRGSLKETQPTSVISQKFVQNNMTPLVNYTDIMNLSPSASSTDNQGPGLTESHHTQMRGFQDGQYNVTFDGIPYGDSNDFTHHSTTFFAAHDVGETIIDRGPGSASTAGDATFGGTVAIVSKDPSPTRAVTAYGTYGSYTTYMGGAEGDSGSFGPSGTQMMVDGAYSGSNTYSQNGKLARSNVFGKLVQPLSNNFVLTAVAMYNDTYQQYSSGATLEQIAKYGSNFGLSSNPLSQNYYGYNTDHYKTDFEYVDLRGTFGDGWTVDSKVYTYAYYHHSLNGIDPLDCGNDTCGVLNAYDLTAKALAGATGSKENSTDTSIVPGQFKFNTYRSFGTIDRLQKDFTVFGMASDVKFGAWYDHQTNTRALVDQNMLTGENLLPAAGSTEPVERLMHDTLDTFQPYFQIDFKPINGLTISPGVKWNYFKRGINAPVNQKTLQPLGYETVYEKALPSVTVNYAVTQDLSVYGQYAEGYLAPNLNVLYSTNPAASNLEPETTQNYQAGVVYQSPRFAGDADVYYIPFNNLATSQTVNGIKEFYNAGGAIYEGLEAEGTYVVGHGVDLYANGSLNSANYNGSHGHNHVAEAPQATAAGGILYDDGMYNGSIIDKWVGGKYGTDSPNKYWMDPYNIVNLSAGVDLKRGIYGAPPIKLTFNIANLTDQRQIYDYAGMTSGYVSGGTKIAALPTFYTLPGRSFFLNLSVPIAF
ncbi:MAG: TonB-dependent receptor [Acidocella sp.]|nr:TonB-dependent receptor [Acidocella sp.]